MTTELIKQLRESNSAGYSELRKRAADALEAMQRELDAVKAENIAHKNSIAIFESQWKELQGELDAAKAEIESHGPEGRNFTNGQVVEMRDKYLSEIAARDLVIQQMRGIIDELWYSNTSDSADKAFALYKTLTPSTEHLDAYVAEKVKELNAEIEKLKAELETERMRLAGCGVAALGYFDGCCDEYRSASLEDTLRLYAKYSAQADALKLCREALVQINHSMLQASVPGNDKLREITLSSKLSNDALVAINTLEK